MQTKQCAHFSAVGGKQSQILTNGQLLFCASLAVYVCVGGGKKVGTDCDRAGFHTGFFGVCGGGEGGRRWKQIMGFIQDFFGVCGKHTHGLESIWDCGHFATQPPYIFLKYHT